MRMSWRRLLGMMMTLHVTRRLQLHPIPPPPPTIHSMAKSLTKRRLTSSATMAYHPPHPLHVGTAQVTQLHPPTRDTSAPPPPPAPPIQFPRGRIHEGRDIPKVPAMGAGTLPRRAVPPPRNRRMRGIPRRSRKRIARVARRRRRCWRIRTRPFMPSPGCVVLRMHLILTGLIRFRSDHGFGQLVQV